MASTSEAQSEQLESTPDERDWGMILTSAMMGLLCGVLGAWAGANLGPLSIIAFVGLTAGVGYYLYQKPTKTIVVGTGLYFVSALVALVPLLYYIPMILNPGEGAEGVGTFIGGIMGLLIWEIVFIVIAFLLGAAGFFINKRGTKKLEAA